MSLMTKRPSALSRRDVLLSASALLLPLPGAVLAQSGGATADPSTLPPVLADLVPARLGEQFRLSKLDARGAGWRDLEIRSAEPGGATRTEKVSIQAGARAMYALPRGQWFVNLKVEQSQAGSYARDRSLCIEALRNIHTLRDESSRRWLAEADEKAREPLASRTLPGLALAELDEAPHHGIETLAASENLYGASGVPTMAHFFLPSREVIVSAYLLHQKDTAVKTLAEYRRLRDAFIDGYAEVLARAVEKDSARQTI